MKKKSRRDIERQARKEGIINAAEKLFCTYGFSRVSMDQIAAEAEFTKRTLYQYFSGKEDLYFAVTLKGFRTLFAYCGKAIEKGGNGFDKIRHAFMAYFHFYTDFPELFRLMNRIGQIRKKAGPGFDEFRQFDNYMFQELSAIIGQGIRDGSIRGDIEPLKTAYSIAFILTGFFHELSETGQSFTAHLGLNEEAFSRYTLDLLAYAIHPHSEEIT
ncbi:MAG: TetR/AcrR family transcriptional regulator [Spirochaetales bacterium]|nr:TetR/AcrR family transcriptional regulator [Spirochaetales bacterium]